MPSTIFLKNQTYQCLISENFVYVGVYTCSRMHMLMGARRGHNIPGLRLQAIVNVQVWMLEPNSSLPQ